MPQPELSQRLENISLEMSPLLQGLGVAHLHEYFSVWAVQEEPFRALVDSVNGIDIALHVMRNQGSQQGVRQAETGLLMASGGVAVVELAGPLMKQVSSLSGGTSTVAARRKIRSAARSEEVTAIVLLIESPGGTAAGTQELADEVAAAAKLKPVHAFIDDLGASAAYWVASQATKVYANASAWVGSIGSFMVLRDTSGAGEKLGVKTHVVRAGDFKGMGTPGTEITAEQIAHIQELINAVNAQFLAGVASGRRMALDKVQSLADGRIHVGAAAVSLGLIDGIQTFDQTLDNLRPKPSSQKSSDRSKTMSEATTEAPKAATLQELKAALPDASNDFVVAQLEANATLAVATKAFLAQQSAELKATQQKLAEAEKAKTEAAAAQPTKPAGQKTLGAGAAATTEAAGDPVSEWKQELATKIKAGVPRAQAVSQLNAERPELRAAYVAAVNAQSKRPITV